MFSIELDFFEITELNYIYTRRVDHGKPEISDADGTYDNEQLKQKNCLLLIQNLHGRSVWEPIRYSVI